MLHALAHYWASKLQHVGHYLTSKAAMLKHAVSGNVRFHATCFEVPQVLKLRDISQINERCMELQRTKRSKTAAINNPDSTVGTSKDMASAAATLAKPARKKAACKAGGCPYLQGGLASSISFKDAVLVQPVDVEELSRMGKAKKVCRGVKGLPCHPVLGACTCYCFGAHV